MAKATKTVRLSEEEAALIQRLREGKLEASDPTVAYDTGDDRRSAQEELAQAFVTAIERTKPKEKKTVANFQSRTPWTPPEGTPKLKMKRKFFHHGLELGKRVSNEEIALLNQIRPGSYCEGFVKVTLRKDRGVDIDYPIKTNSQRLKLVNQFGIRSFVELLQRIVDEHANPKKYRRPEDMDLFEDGV